MKKDLLVSAEQALNGLRDVKAYCNQTRKCLDCSLYAWCCEINEDPSTWDVGENEK